MPELEKTWRAISPDLLRRYDTMVRKVLCSDESYDDVDVIVAELQVPSSSDEEAGVGPKRKRTIADANALFGSSTIERERTRCLWSSRHRCSYSAFFNKSQLAVEERSD